MSTVEHSAGCRIGDYQIERELGSGGMGAVHLARHVETGAMVALKVMHPGIVREDVWRRRFLREARATIALDHPNIIRIVASFEHGGEPVIAMEVLHGRSLKDHLKQEGKLAVDEAAGIFQRVVSGVGAAHALGLIHRDLKPDNVFLLETEPYVKVLDFGIAKLPKGGALSESSALTKTGAMIGSPFYMSPEQAFGERDIDHRADIWSLGVMLYEILSGQLLTRADRLEEVFRRLLTMDFPRLDEVDPEIPADIADMVSRMLQRDVDERLSDLRVVQAVLARYALDIDAREFAPPSRPLSFDEQSGGSGPVALRLVAPPPDLVAPESQPLELAPGALKPAKPSLDLGPVSRAVATSRRAPTVMAPAPKSPAWMWIVATLIVIGSIVLLLTQR